MKKRFLKQIEWEELGDGSHRTRHDEQGYFYRVVKQGNNVSLYKENDKLKTLELEGVHKTLHHAKKQLEGKLA